MDSPSKPYTHKTFDKGGETPTQQKSKNDLHYKPSNAKVNSNLKNSTSKLAKNSPSINRNNTKGIAQILGNVLISKGREFVLENLTFTNAEDLAYDCRKFIGTKIRDVNVTLVGTNLT